MPALLSKSKYLTGLQCPKYLCLQIHEPERIPEADAVTRYIFNAGYNSNQACYKSGIMSPEYLSSEPEQGLDGIVACVIIMVNAVGNGAKWV